MTIAGSSPSPAPAAAAPATSAPEETPAGTACFFPKVLRVYAQPHQAAILQAVPPDYAHATFCELASTSERSRSRQYHVPLPMVALSTTSIAGIAKEAAPDRRACLTSMNGTCAAAEAPAAPKAPAAAADADDDDDDDDDDEDLDLFGELTPVSRSPSRYVPPSLPGYAACFGPSGQSCSLGNLRSVAPPSML